MRLVVVEGKAKGQQLRLDARPSCVVGSGPEAELRLEDPAVAAFHVRLALEGEGWVASDVSETGFVCNGNRTRRAPVNVGDVLQVGAHVLRLLSDAADVSPLSQPTPPPAAGACLVARKGNDAGKTFPLGGKPVQILGRGVATDITIWDIRASRAHCRLDGTDGAYTLTDLNSSNGTWVNEERLHGSRPLAAGDCIRIGSTVLEFLPEPPA